MSREYPRLGSKKKPNPKAGPKDGKDCLLCRARTTGKVWIEVSYIRGDDELEPVCADCQKLPDQEIVDRICIAWIGAQQP